MDQVFLSVNYINDDYMRMKKQEFENINKKEALELIQTINDKSWKWISFPFIIAI